MTTLCTVPGNLLRSGEGSGARFVGQSPGLKVKWQVDPHLCFTADLSAFAAAAFLRAAPPSRTITYVAAVDDARKLTAISGVPEPHTMSGTEVATEATSLAQSGGTLIINLVGCLLSRPLQRDMLRGAWPSCGGTAARLRVGVPWKGLLTRFPKPST